MAMDPAIVNNDANKMRSIEKEINKPNGRFWTAPGALASGRNYFKEIPRNQVTQDMFNQIQSMIGYIDRIGKQTSTMDGISDSAHDTGILFARRAAQAEVAMTIMTKGVEQDWNEKGEAYLEIAKYLYSDVYRQVSYKDGITQKQTVLKLNKPVASPEGIAVENDIKKLPRHKVVVAQSPMGISIKTTERIVNAELLRALPPENQLSRAQIVKNVMSTLEMSSEDRQKLEQTANVEYEFALMNMQTQMMNMKATQAQLEAQMQQAMMPPMSPQGEAPPEGGMPLEGAQMPQEASQGEMPQEAPAEQPMA
jgi:hypothetical protein